MSEEAAPEQHICLDCALHAKTPSMSTEHPGYCVHFTPEYWEAQGWERGWGDAAVRAWPTLEILRKQTIHPSRARIEIEFLVLCPAVRRPVHLYLHTTAHGWGSY